MTKLLTVLALILSGQAFANAKVEKNITPAKTNIVGELSSGPIDETTSESLNMKASSATAQLSDEVSNIMSMNSEEESHLEDAY